MQKLLNKFFSPGECALIRKDFAEIWSQKMVRSSLLVLPLMMSFGLPLLFLLIAALAPLEEIDIGPFRTLLGTALPVWVETLRTAAYEPVTVELTEEQAQQRAYEKIRQMQEIYLGEEGVLLSETVTYSLKDGVVYAFSECVCEENIAEAVPISSGT